MRPGVRKATLAHELYHAFQAAYATRQKCHIYSEWNEALATWAGNYAYPGDNVEHAHDGVLKKADVPMHAWGYATWVFPYYLTQRFGADTIRRIEEAREKHLNDIHVDRAIPGGFHERFPDFSVYAYNRTPVPGVPGIASTYQQWDGLAAGPESVPSYTLAEGENPLPMQTLRVLSREYRRVEVSDPSLRKVEFCRDEPGEDVREVILAYSDSSLERRLSPATSFTAEESCSMRFRILETRIEYQTNASADHILCGRQSGRIAFGGTGGAQDSTGEPLENVRGQVRGSIAGHVVGGWSGHHLEACKMIPTKQACSADMPPTAPQPDGRWPISFSVRGGANDPMWTLDWGFDSPSVGFFDAYEDECHVYMWGYFDNEASLREVPRSTFMQSGPFTLTFEGSGTAPHTPNLTNAVINHEWRYSMTLQRVD